MLVAPINEKGKQALVIVLEKENVERMAAGDPATFMLRDHVPGAPDIEIVLATVEDKTKFRDAGALLQHVFRGYEFRKTEDGYKPFSVFGGKQA